MLWFLLCYQSCKKDNHFVSSIWCHQLSLQKKKKLFQNLNQSFTSLCKNNSFPIWLFVDHLRRAFIHPAIIQNFCLDGRRFLLWVWFKWKGVGIVSKVLCGSFFVQRFDEIIDEKCIEILADKMKDKPVSKSFEEVQGWWFQDGFYLCSFSWFSSLKVRS